MGIISAILGLFGVNTNLSADEWNERLAYALRAKKLSIEKNNSKLGDADYLPWHVNTFKPMIKRISGAIADCREGATVGIPPIIEGIGPAPTKEASDKYALERTTFENDTKYDTDIKTFNPELR